MGEEPDISERLAQMQEGIETDDVGQKRYMMYRILDEILEHQHDDIVPEQKVAKLKEKNGYLYKLVQEFLTSSSTVEKERKIQKMIDHIGR